MEILKKYKNITDNIDTLFSIIIYNKNIEDIIKFFEDQLEKARKINNPIKKNKVNNRLYSFIQYLNDLLIHNNNINNTNKIINSIFFIHDKIISYELNESEINTANEFNFLNIYFKYDNHFYIDYFIDLFYNFNFIYTIKVNKYDIYIIKLNQNKEKEVVHNKISNDISIFDSINKVRNNFNYKDVIILHGNSQFINKIETNNKIKELFPLIINKDFLSKEESFNLYSDECMKKNLLLLENKLSELNNDKTNVELYVFGKLKFEIKDAIESYLLKELYIEETKLDKLKTFIDDSYFNFKIIPIKSLTNGDIGEMFIKNYNGLMGIKYF